MEEKESQARALLDKTNRQFNECNALYHAAAQRCDLPLRSYRKGKMDVILKTI